MSHDVMVRNVTKHLLINFIHAKSKLTYFYGYTVRRTLIVRRALMSYLGLVRINCSSIPSIYFRIILSKLGTSPAGVSIKWNNPMQKLGEEGELIIGRKFVFACFRKKYSGLWKNDLGIMIGWTVGQLQSSLWSSPCRPKVQVKEYL